MWVQIKELKPIVKEFLWYLRIFSSPPGVCKIPLQGRRSMRSRAHVLLPDRLAWLSLRIAAASATLAELMGGGIAFALPFGSRGLARLAGGRCLAPWLLGRRQT
jgi:hypothetical protein